MYLQCSWVDNVVASAGGRHERVDRGTCQVVISTLDEISGVILSSAGRDGTLGVLLRCLLHCSAGQQFLPMHGKPRCSPELILEDRFFLVGVCLPCAKTAEGVDMPIGSQVDVCWALQTKP